VLQQKLKDYQQLTKLNLSLLVVCSSVVGYIIIPDLAINWGLVAWLFLGGLLVTASANALNEVMERNTDAIMRRTSTRPIPTKRMSKLEAYVFAGLSLLIGLFILNSKFNFNTALLSLVSHLLYVLVYTPMKKISPLSVLIGAIPGSLPCLIGWVAGTNHCASWSAWTLFSIQFIWQFPHFWSIAWIGHDDYEKAGMKMLPRMEKVGHFTAMQCVLYTSVLIPMSVLPMVTLNGSLISAIPMAMAAAWFLYNAIQFLKEVSDAKARKLMFASFIYLPIVLIALVMDKFF
jgi:heme o synthase